jgi:pyroglutamyl-peptidase
MAIVSGYEPFGDYRGNPSERIAKKLDGVMLEGIRIKGTVLRNTYDSHDQLMGLVLDERKKQGISAEEPVVVVSGGLSSSIHKISLEALGWNEIDSKYADADGILVNDKRPVVPGAVGAYRTDADLVAVSLELSKLGIPAIVSTDPGRFTCNSIAFGMFNLITEIKERTLFLFYHTGLHEGDLAGELPPSKIYHPPEWLEKGVPSMIQTLARQAALMASRDEWSFPMSMDIGQVETKYYKK